MEYLALIKEILRLLDRSATKVTNVVLAIVVLLLVFHLLNI